MCKNAVLILSVYPSKLENKPVKIEQLLLLSYNFTYVASVKYFTSQMHIFKKNWKTHDGSKDSTRAFKSMCYVPQANKIFE
jgi:hypothetical protein